MHGYLLVFFFNDTATTEIYTLSLHDALPICSVTPKGGRASTSARTILPTVAPRSPTIDCFRGLGSRSAPCTSIQDRKSTRLNSSHANISYAVFCLKKKKKKYYT